MAGGGGYLIYKYRLRVSMVPIIFFLFKTIPLVKFYLAFCSLQTSVYYTNIKNSVGLSIVKISVQLFRSTI